MSIPLILKVRPGAEPHFECDSASVISFQQKKYAFSAIYHNDIPDASIDKLTSSSSALVLIGPTGSGKTTTLNAILRRKIASRSDLHITVCEVKENRQLVDLLDDGATKKYLASMPLEKQLKKLKLTPTAVRKVFAMRQTASTDSNAESSRSCLIVNLHSNSQTTTIVDMMGNEKFSPAGSTTNTFANTNVSSITQLLLSKTTKTRSSNLVTNLIFNRPTQTKVKFILHLHQSGCPDLIKSSLYNIVDVVKNFRVGEPKTSTEAGKQSGVPNYARPTAASISPRKRTAFKVVKPVRLSPSQSNVPKTSTRGVSTPSRLTTKGGPKLMAKNQVVNKVTKSLYEEQLKRLKESNEILEDTAKKHKQDLDDLRQKWARTVADFKSHTFSIKNDGLNPLTKQLILMKEKFDNLVSTYTAMKQELIEKNGALALAKSLTKDKDQEISDIQSQLLKLQEDHASLQRQHSSELENLSSELEGKNRLVSELQESLRTKSIDSQSLADELKIKASLLLKLQESLEAKSNDYLNLDALLAQTRQLLQETQTSLDEKSQIMMVLESDLQHKEQMLAESITTNDIKEKEIASTRKEAASLTMENGKMLERLSALEGELRDYERIVSEKESVIGTEISKTQNAEKLCMESRKAEQSLSDKIDQLSHTIEDMKSEKEDFARKHTELVSYNKYIVEKYTGVLQDNEKMKQELSSLKEELVELRQGAKDAAELKVQLSKKTDELEKLQLQEVTTIEAELREEIRTMESQYQQQLADLKREKEELRQSLIAGASPKRFNASDIFEDSRKDLKNKKSKKSFHIAKNVLMESNLLASEKKKTKRRASSYHTAIKSPKLPTKV